MREKTEEVKGRAKEAAGVLTENKQLKRSGQADQRAAKVKKKLSNVTEKTKKGMHNAVDRLRGKGGRS